MEKFDDENHVLEWPFDPPTNDATDEEIAEIALIQTACKGLQGPLSPAYTGEMLFHDI